jgi:REP element-mobilizing transposase RayT
MSQSLAQIYIHIVFSTKYRKPLIQTEIEEELYAYIGGIIKNLKGNSIKINGVSNHIHILTTLPKTVTLSKYLEEIKRSSSKWIKTKGTDYKNFSWQRGYGAFSVSSYKVDVVKNYVTKQKEHHKSQDFKEEFIEFLDEYKVEYDDRYLWD